MTSNKTKIFIDGQHGTTGLQILDRLKDRPDIELLELPMADRTDLGKRAELAKHLRRSLLPPNRLPTRGCYPRGAIAILRPLVEAAIVRADSAPAVFGVS